MASLPKKEKPDHEKFSERRNIAESEANRGKDEIERGGLGVLGESNFGGRKEGPGQRVLKRGSSVGEAQRERLTGDKKNLVSTFDA